MRSTYNTKNVLPIVPWGIIQLLPLFFINKMSKNCVSPIQNMAGRIPCEQMAAAV